MIMLRAKYVLLWVRDVSFLALLYVIAAKLGLFLAIPPGFSTSIWPPSGIALAWLIIFGYSRSPGVLIGSFLINLYIASGTSDIGNNEVLVALAIACGSTVQAIVGAFLIKKFVKLPTILDKEMDVFVFILIAGPVSSTISTSIANTALLIAGNITPDRYFFSWWTWWIGDSIGAIIFAPILLILSETLEVISLFRKAAIIMPLVAMFSAVVLCFVTVRNAEEKRFFEKQNEILTKVFATNSYEEGVAILKSDESIKLLSDQANLIDQIKERPEE